MNMRAAVLFFSQTTCDHSYITTGSATCKRSASCLQGRKSKLEDAIQQVTEYYHAPEGEPFYPLVPRGMELRVEERSTGKKEAPIDSTPEHRASASRQPSPIRHSRVTAGEASTKHAATLEERTDMCSTLQEKHMNLEN